jgi:hypothetical protein
MSDKGNIEKESVGKPWDLVRVESIVAFAVYGCQCLPKLTMRDIYH